MSRPNPDCLTWPQLMVFKLRVCFAFALVCMVVLFGTRKAMIHAMAAAAVFTKKAPSLSDWINRGMP